VKIEQAHVDEKGIKGVFGRLAFTNDLKSSMEDTLRLYAP
jgi:hypothetical protein